MKKVVRSSLIATIILGLLVSGISCSESPSQPPVTPAPEPARAPAVSSIETPLPESRPPMPPTIVGSATLEPYGTNILIDGFGANRAFSEYFYFSTIAEDRYMEELIVDIVICSDCMNRYKLREPGYIFFELKPCSGQGLWEFSPEKLIYENASTSKDGRFLYTTEVMGRLRARGDFSAFQIHIASFDPHRQHSVSWEIYVWREGR